MILNFKRNFALTSLVIGLNCQHGLIMMLYIAEMLYNIIAAAIKWKTLGIQACIVIFRLASLCSTQNYWFIANTFILMIIMHSN